MAGTLRPVDGRQATLPGRLGRTDRDCHRPVLRGVPGKQGQRPEEPSCQTSASVDGHHEKPVYRMLCSADPNHWPRHLHCRHQRSLSAEMSSAQGPAPTMIRPRP